jgi:hypothetical protein
VSTADEGTTSGDELAGLLSGCTEAGRLKRSIPLAGKVHFLLGDGELIIAAVAKYNVVINVAARCIQHGCRDFQSQAPTRRLCKHVAATILALDEPLARRIAEELADCAAAPESGVVVPWRFEVISRWRER